MIDLSLPADRKTLEAQILSDIDQYCADKYNEGHRNHLGASELGEDCHRKLWYKFRWVKNEIHSGRVQRLFQVGHQSEPRFIDYLRAIGFTVWEKDPSTGKQFRITGVNGHYGGSLDGICNAPERYEISEKLAFLNEFKTNGTGAGFTNVDKKGVQVEKPKHYAQMSQYGKYYQLKYGLYLIENKNDSSLIPKIVPLDWNYGADLETKAAQIINSQVPPFRISENAAFWDCKICHFANICHSDEKVEINCRSCKNASPIANGKWFCSAYINIIPKDFIKVGCSQHVSINT